MEAAPGGLSAIGIDVSALLFQVVNFAILLWLLKRFAYRPIVKLLEARRQKIEESLTTAEAVAKDKLALGEERVRLLTEAEAEGSALIARGKQASAALREAAQAQGARQAESMLAEAHARLEQERRQLSTSLQSETLNLVRQATERLLRQKLDRDADAQLIQAAIKEVKTS